MLAGQWAAVGIGAMLGAWVRWGLGLTLNDNIIPYGTLLANLLGGFLMGLAFAVFLTTSSDNNTMRLFVMTGFLGGLTTFSTFSVEAFTLIQKQYFTLAAVHIVSHVAGSLIMTALGFWVAYRLKG